jgi:hypothetical protein
LGSGIRALCRAARDPRFSTILQDISLRWLSAPSSLSEASQVHNRNLMDKVNNGRYLQEADALNVAKKADVYERKAGELELSHCSEIK